MIRVLRRLRRAFAHEIWNIGIVPQTVADIAARGICTTVRWLAPLPAFTMLADPTAELRTDGSLTMFAEYLDYRVLRGEIWSADVPAGGDPASACLAPLIRTDLHLSYPTCFGDGAGGRMLAAECWRSGGVPLWRLEDRRPVPAGAWLRGKTPVDPTLLRHEGRWYLFCTFRDTGPDEHLSVFHAAQLDGNWQPVRGNPVRSGRYGSRPAGPIFAAGGDLIRPGQDCAHTYGGGVVLHRISRLDPDGYNEEVVRRLGPVPGTHDAGLHTICAAGDVTLIDGKRWQIDPIKPLRQLRRRLRRA